MKVFRKSLALALLVGMLAGSASAQSTNSAFNPGGTEPCNTYPKQTANFNISSATTTSVIAPVTSQNIYVCGYVLNQAGGAGTVSFEGGTGATCGTSTAVLSGPYTANTSAGTTTNYAVGFLNTEVFDTRAVASSRLCILSTGTIVQSGHILYVQGP